MPPESSEGRKVEHAFVEPHLGEQFGRFAPHPGGFPRAPLSEAERHVPPDRQRVEKGAALEQHAELGADAVQLAGRGPDNLLAVDLDRPPIGHKQAEDALEEHRLAGAGLADHRQRLAGRDVEVEPGQHALGAEALVQVANDDARAHPKAATVMSKFESRMRMKAETTAAVVARPTPAAPPPERKP
jgi:hypothetical protein